MIDWNPSLPLWGIVEEHLSWQDHQSGAEGLLVWIALTDIAALLDMARRCGWCGMRGKPRPTHCSNCGLSPEWLP